MAWYDGIVGFFETAWTIPEKLQYKKPEGDIEGAKAALAELGPYEYGSGGAETSYGAPWGFIFNPSEVGLAPLDKNKADAAQEIAVQEGEPVIKSSYLDILYGGMLKACYEEQHHLHCNPNAAQACQDLANRNDYSGLILVKKQRNLLGAPTPADQPSDMVLQWENNPERIFTVSPDKTPKPSATTWSDFVSGWRKGYNLEPKAPGQVGEPENRNVFQESIDKWGAGISNIAKTPNYATALVIGGAVLLLLLVIKR